MISQLLYRGDGDALKERSLRTVYPGSAYGGLLTNLSNGGSGREIFSSPLISTVNRHVDVGWEKTHYLSFSEHRARAMVFASGKSGKDLKPVEFRGSWEAALITLDTGSFTKYEELEIGVYRCLYLRNPISTSQLSIPALMMRLGDNAHRVEHSVEILLIDVVSFLCAQIEKTKEDLSTAIANAKRDAEWLVLPTDYAVEIHGEFTSKLDDGCIQSFERFRFLS